MFVTWIYSQTVFTGRLSLENSSGAQDYVIYFQFSWRCKNNLGQVLTFLTGLKWKKDDVIPCTTQRLGTFILKCDERYWLFADVFRLLSIKSDKITHKQSCWSRLAEVLTLLRWGTMVHSQHSKNVLGLNLFVLRLHFLRCCFSLSKWCVSTPPRPSKE